jgi:hypothetical protein
VWGHKSMAKDLVPRLAPLIVVLATQIAIGPLAPAFAATDRVSLFPQLHTGDKLNYLVQYHIQKNVKTESRVVSPSGPQDARTDAQWILHLEVLDVHPQGDRATIHARSYFQSANSVASGNPGPAGDVPPATPPEEFKFVEFTILPDGRADSVTGLTAIFPEQREAWQQWLRQFAIAAVFPKDGVKRGQSWKATESEQAQTPIDKLQWEKTFTYVRDEPCAPAQVEAANTVAEQISQRESCAVILTKARLKQKSSPKDTTPPDFKLHALRTTGNATGSNETISYIAIRTGLLMRVSEDAKQFMDVVIAKTDGSNQVHYNVDAARHSEVLLLASPPLAVAPPSKP